MRRSSSKTVTAMVGGSSKDHHQQRLKVLDGYHTPKIATLELIRREDLSDNLWEPANGYSRITRVLERKGYNVFASDIHRWCDRTEKVRDFFNFKKLPIPGCDIVTNPPYYYAGDFVEHGLSLLEDGGKVCLLLRLQFLEGKKRKDMFTKNPHGRLKRVWVFSYRIPRMHRFGYKGTTNGSAIAFAWFVFQKGYFSHPRIHWI